MKLYILALLALLPIIRAEQGYTDINDAAFDISTSCKGNCKCPAGYTLTIDPGQSFPPLCQDIRWTRKVKCNVRRCKDDEDGDDEGNRKDCGRKRPKKPVHKAVGACVARKSEFRPYCKLPEYLLKGCTLNKCGEESCGAVSIKGDIFACLKRVETPRQCDNVCPPGFDAQCFEVRGLGCKPAEITVDDCDASDSSSDNQFGPWFKLPEVPAEPECQPVRPCRRS